MNIFLHYNSNKPKMDQFHFELAINIKPKQLPQDTYMTVTESSINLLGLSSFQFDYLFTDSPSEDLFKFIDPSLSLPFRGTNLNIFTYSEQPNSFSIFSDHSNTISPTLSSIFASENRENFTFSCSFFQIVNETLTDLLQSPERPQKFSIKKDLNDAIIVENLSEYVIEKQSDAEFLINQGLDSSLFSDSADRTLVFQVFLESRKANNKGLFLKSKISFADLPFTGQSQKAFKSCLNSLLSSSAQIPYKDSKLTQILSDSLTMTSQNLVIATISPFQKDSESTLQVLNTLKNFNNTQIVPLKNFSPANHKPELFLEISKLKSNLKSKQSCDEVWKAKEKTDLLKNQLHQKTTIEEVEDLIKENKELRIELQELVGRPLAENDLEHPESFQTALVLTEELIKRRKLDLASAEMKEKLEKEGRCLICTLKQPCKHSNKDSLVVFKPKEQVLQLGYEEAHTFLTAMEAEGPKKFRIRSSRGKLEIQEKPQEDKTEKMIREAQKKLKILNKIEVYREEKLRKEIEKIEYEAKVEKETIEQQKAEMDKKKKYFDSQREKLNEYSLKRREEDMLKQRKERANSQKPKKKPLTQAVKIRDYENRRFQVFEILKQQSKMMKTLKSHRVKSAKRNEDSLDLLDIEDY